MVWCPFWAGCRPGTSAVLPLWWSEGQQAYMLAGVTEAFAHHWTGRLLTSIVLWGLSFRLGAHDRHLQIVCLTEDHWISLSLKSLLNPPFQLHVYQGLVIVDRLTVLFVLFGKARNTEGFSYWTNIKCSSIFFLSFIKIALTWFKFALLHKQLLKISNTMVEERSCSRLTLFTHLFFIVKFS